MGVWRCGDTGTRPYGDVRVQGHHGDVGIWRPGGTWGHLGDRGIRGRGGTGMWGGGDGRRGGELQVGSGAAEQRGVGCPMGSGSPRGDATLMSPRFPMGPRVSLSPRGGRAATPRRSHPLSATPRVPTAPSMASSARRSATLTSPSGTTPCCGPRWVLPHRVPPRRVPPRHPQRGASPCVPTDLHRLLHRGAEEVGC